MSGRKPKRSKHNRDAKTPSHPNATSRPVQTPSRPPTRRAHPIPPPSPTPSPHPSPSPPPTPRTPLLSVPSAPSNVGQSTISTPDSSALNDDYRVLLSPMFSVMTRITDNLFLTGVSGMTRENFRRNHIDFVVNITTDAPFWNDIESLRIALEDDASTNMLPYLDFAVDKINDAIVHRNAHVLVHCTAGVSRSATVVIAYLMKYRHMDLRTAFNHCYNLRPVIRPNNGFMSQLINYEFQLFGRSTARMTNANINGTPITIPDFFLHEHPSLVMLEVLRAREVSGAP